VDLSMLTDTDAKAFEAGETLYIYNGEEDSIGTGSSEEPGYYLGNSTHATDASDGAADDVVDSGETAEIKIIDVASQQFISDIDVRF
jgi:hypothetical protein